MKKNVALVRLIISMFAVVLCGVLAQPVVAGAEEANSPEPQETVSAYLENENGERIEVIGKLVPSIQPYSENGEESATYVFDLSSADPELTMTDNDITLSVKAWLKIRFRRGDNGASVLLTGVSGGWTRMDSTVDITNVSLNYGCVDIGPVTSGQKRSISSVSNNFSYNTGFTQYVPTAVGTAGANMFLSLRRGTAGSTWTFHIQNLYCNGGLPIG